MSVLGITDFWICVPGVIFVILLPGLNSLSVLVTSTQHGMATSYRATCGVFPGGAMLVLLSTFSVASLLKTEPMLFIGLKYLGTAYLFYLGVGMLRGVWHKLRNPEVMAAQAGQVDVHQPFRKALLLNPSNLKAILFFTLFLIRFVDPDYAYPRLSFLVLTVAPEPVSAPYLSFLIFTGVWLATWFRRRQRLAAGTTPGAGTLFVGFGVKLATATLS